MTLKCLCQHCGCEIEFDAEYQNHDWECPHCKRETHLEAVARLELSDIKQLATKAIQIPPTCPEAIRLEKINKIRASAQNMEGLSKIAAAIGVLIGVGIAFSAVLSLANQAEVITGFGIAGAFLVIGFLGFLVSQIIHIRANTYPE